MVEACSEALVDDKGDQYTPQLDELALDLRAKFTKIQSGDLADPEAMLFAQAHALQSLFSYLAVSALKQTTVSLMKLQMSVALRAQAQSRATLTALAALKHSRQPNFIGQQNVALSQQVNNSVPPASKASETEIRQIKLLEVENGERLDTRATSTTSGGNQALEAVGEIERPQNRGGEGQRGAQRVQRRPPECVEATRASASGRIVASNPGMKTAVAAPYRHAQNEGPLVG